MSQTFPIAPAGGPWAGVVLGLVTVALLATVVAVGRAVLAGTTASFEVTPTALTLRGDWWGRTLLLADLRVADARIVDLEAHPDLRPAVRTWGTGLPGYQGGWFRLRNGEKALLYLTDRKRAVVVPTRLGFTLLLSPRDPEGFLAALRSAR